MVPAVSNKEQKNNGNQEKKDSRSAGINNFNKYLVLLCLSSHYHSCSWWIRGHFINLNMSMVTTTDPIQIMDFSSLWSDDHIQWNSNLSSEW